MIGLFDCGLLLIYLPISFGVTSLALAVFPGFNEVATSHMIFFNSRRPRQNGRHFADDIFKRIFLNENVWISFKISPKFVPQVQINNIPALVEIMAWRRLGESHYQNQWWLVYWHIYGSFDLNDLRASNKMECIVHRIRERLPVWKDCMIEWSFHTSSM